MNHTNSLLVDAAKNYVLRGESISWFCSSRDEAMRVVRLIGDRLLASGVDGKATYVEPETPGGLHSVKISPL